MVGELVNLLYWTAHQKGGSFLHDLIDERFLLMFSFLSGGFVHIVKLGGILKQDLSVNWVHGRELGLLNEETDEVRHLLCEVGVAKRQGFSIPDERVDCVSKISLRQGVCSRSAE